MPSRERSLRVESIILRHNDWGEADRLLGMYTREMGKLRAIAKGVRKPRSRKAGHLEPFTRVNLLLAKGRDLWIVTQAETVNAHINLRQDLLRVGYASYVVELLDRFTYEEGENPALYRLLSDTLARLDSQSGPGIAIHYYEIRLLDLLGFRPQLFTCAACQEEIRPRDQFFSAALGGVLCPRCGSATAGATPVSMAALKYLRHFQRSSYAEAAHAHPAPEVEREIERLVQYYLTYLLERGLNTPAFLRRVRQPGADLEE
jgi:DNA repair protein RecO (recombination protein O)